MWWNYQGSIFQIANNCFIKKMGLRKKQTNLYDLTAPSHLSWKSQNFRNPISLRILWHCLLISKNVQLTYNFRVCPAEYNGVGREADRPYSTLFTSCPTPPRLLPFYIHQKLFSRPKVVHTCLRGGNCHEYASVKLIVLLCLSSHSFDSSESWFAQSAGASLTKPSE